jgi:hypothetical protein
MRKTAIAVLVQLVLVAGARADDPPAAPEAATGLHEDAEIGPVILIESIEITGNTATETEIIRRAVPIQPGDILHASDHRLRDTRFKLLALGFFRDVSLAMRKGSARGQVVIEIHVSERGTFVLNRLWFGTNNLTPYWFGTDVGERNLLGLGISVGGGAIYAAHGNVVGSRDQWAGEIRVADGSLRGTRWGVTGSMTLVHGSEPYRIAGPDDDTSDAYFRAFPYRRFGGRFGVTYDFSALTRLSATIRLESIDAELPIAPTQQLEDGSLVAVDLHLQNGHSRVITAGFGFDRDTRPDPVLPHSGSRITASAEVGTSALDSSYDFSTAFGRYERWWPIDKEERTTVGLKLAGGIVIGDAPRFDRIHISDVDHLLTPRALGLVLSVAAPLDILHTRIDKPSYGELGGSATVEVARTLWRGHGRGRIYGGDLFVATGLWGLAETDNFRLRDTGVWKSLPIDVYGDIGVRLDTDVGIFELTIANALGRLR